MVITRIFQRRICTASLGSRMKSLENARIKRPLLKNTNPSVMSVRKAGAYEAEGKTVAVLVNRKRAEVFYIDKYMTDGFIMPNGSQLIGSLMIFPHTVISWNVRAAEDVTEDSLVLFKLLEPKIDILVFGYGCRGDFTPEVRANFTKCCKNLGLRFEALPTDQAVGTYNFLADERRLVAGALIPPRFVDVLKFDRNKKMCLEDEDKEEEEEVTTIDTGSPTIDGPRKNLLK